MGLKNSLQKFLLKKLSEKKQKKKYYYLLKLIKLLAEE
jgi:hypothetical protein